MKTFDSKVTEQILKEIWATKDLESKRKLALDTISQMTRKKTSVVEIEKAIKSTNSTALIDKKMTDLLLVSNGLKTIF